MALVMFRCFECDFISNSIKDVRIHILLEHKDGIKYSESNEVITIGKVAERSRSQNQDSPCIVPKEALIGSMRWTPDMVQYLLKCYKKHEEKFNEIGYTSKQVWYHIAKDFSQKYLDVSSDSCYEKWRNLKRTYKNVKRNLEQNGRSRIKFQYFDEMDDILSKKATIFRPITIIAAKSLPEKEVVIRNEINEVDATVTETSDVVATVTEERNNISSSSLPSNSRKQHAVPDCCSHFLLEMQKIADAKEVSDQKRHEEKMGLLRELIDIKKKKLLMLQKSS